MSDQAIDVWGDLVAAERKVAELRVEFGHLHDHNTLLSASLDPGGNRWEQHAALNYLYSRTSDVAMNVPELFELSMGNRWGSHARDILTKGERVAVLRQVRDASASWHMAEVEDYANLAALFVALGAREDAASLIAGALRSSSAEIRGIGQYLADYHGFAAH